MPNIADKAWSPYVAGAVIGLLQIPTFLLMDTALGASSSFVTVGAHVAALFESRVDGIKYLASHLWGAKNCGAGNPAATGCSGPARRGTAPDPRPAAAPP